MLQKLLIIVLIILFDGCAPYRDIEDRTGNPESIRSRFETVKMAKNQSLPQSFVQCSESFYWSTEKFASESLEYGYVQGKDPKYGPIKAGFNSVHINYIPSEDESRICEDIGDKIRGVLLTEHNVYQQFDAQEVLKAVQSGSGFNNVAPQMAYIENIAYKMEDNGKKEEIYRVSIPVKVVCENNWSVKEYVQYPFRAYFQQPKGKCKFSTKGYDLKMSPHEKFTIALNGFYEIDSEYPDKIMIVNIDSYGFLPKMPSAP
jgi:hypothetical protein